MCDREHLGLIDIRAERNAFGRQVRSFEAQVDIGLSGGPIEALFIRAPWIAEHGPEVEILAEVDGHAVAAREGSVPGRRPTTLRTMPVTVFSTWR